MKPSTPTPPPPATAAAATNMSASQIQVSELFSLLVSSANPASSLTACQLKVFEKLSLLCADALGDLDSKQRMDVERVLREIVLGEFGARAGALTLPLCQLLGDAWARLYAFGDTKNTLTLAGEFQDVAKSKTHSAHVQAAALYSLGGISRSRGKSLAGHFPETIQIALQALQPRNNQAFKVLTGLTFGAVQAPTTAAPPLRVAAVEALNDGLQGAGEAARREWPNALKVLIRAASVKSSASVRLAGVRGMAVLASMPNPIDKLVANIVPSLVDPDVDVRMLAAEAMGVALGAHQQAPPTALAAPDSAPKPALLLVDVQAGTCSFAEALDAIRHAATQPGVDFQLKQMLGRTMVAALSRAPLPDSHDSLVASVDAALSLANVDDQPARQANESTLVAAYVLRAALGSKIPERLQLVAISHLVAWQTKPRAAQRRAALVELQHLVLTLGQGSASVRQLLLSTLVPRLLSEDAATALHVGLVLRAMVLALPTCTAELCQALFEHLMATQSNAEHVGRPVLGLCFVIRAAAAVNRGGAINPSSLFGMAKALASRQLDMDPTLMFTQGGWDLIAALLSLGPSFWGPHLTQLFALWQEALDGPHTVSVSAVNALATLLRASDVNDEAVLGRASAILLNKVLSPGNLRVDAQNPEYVRLHAALLEAASRCSTSLRSEEQTLLPLALGYIEGALGARTTLLEVGGLLIPANDVLDFHSAAASASDDAAWDMLGRADCDVSVASMKDALEACCDLHALVGRRARSRPGLGARLGGGHLSEAPLPPAQATCVAPGAAASQRVADAACAFVASAFARGDDATRTRLLFLLSGRLKENKDPARAAVNVLATVLSALRMLLHRDEPGDCLWHSNCASIVQTGLVHALPAVRRAAAQSLAALAKLAPPVQQSLVGFLEATMANPDADCSGALLAAARMRREDLQAVVGDAVVRRAPKESVVYEACKQTTQPVRVWALHAWHLIVQGASVGDAGRYVRPTLALIMAHLLADCPPAVEGEREHAATQSCLARLLCTVAQSMGPELGADDEVASRLVAAWRVLVRWPSAAVQRQCVKFVELVALFHPGKFSADAQFKTEALALVNHHLALASLSLTAGTITCALRLAERDVDGLAGNPELRRRLFAALEKASRAAPPVSQVGLCPATATWDLRSAWSRAEMQGAAGPQHVVVPDRYQLYYPPDLEEQVCHIAVEMVRGSKVLGDWFTFCKHVISGGGESQQPEDAEDEAPPGATAPAASAASAASGEATAHAVLLREPRWQTRAVAVECLNAVVRSAALSGAEHMDLKRARAAGDALPLVARLESLLSCAGQAATASVGDVGVPTLQARGLACLARIVTIFARHDDPDVPGFPLLRQYEAQLNATLRPGLGRAAVPELAGEAANLAATVLVYGVSTSARRLVGTLVATTLVDTKNAALGGSNGGEGGGGEGNGNDDDEEEDFDGFAASASDDDEGGGAGGGGAGASSAAQDADDVDSSQLLLAKCAALARLALAAQGKPGAFDTQDEMSQTAFRDDARAAIAKALPASTMRRLVALWTAIVRDATVLAMSRGMAAPRRHPEALYEGGRTRDDVAALLPAYSRAWSVAAQAAAEAVGTPSWTGKESDVALLVAACAKAVDEDDEPLRALLALRALAVKDGGLGVEQADVLRVVVSRAHKAWARGKTRVLETALQCLCSALGNEEASLGVFKGDLALWQSACELVVGQLVARFPAGPDVVAASLACLKAMAPHCPSPEYAPFLLNGCIGKAAAAVVLKEPAALAAFKACAAINDAAHVDGALLELVLRAEAGTSPRAAVLFAAVAETFGALHRRVAACLAVKLAADAPADVRAACIEDLCALVAQRRKTGLWLVALLVKDACDTLADPAVGLGALALWRAVFLEDAKRAGDVGWAPLIAYLGGVLAKDPTRAGHGDQRKAFGAFLLQAARTSPAAFKAAVARMMPQHKAVVEEAVRLALAG